MLKAIWAQLPGNVYGLVGQYPCKIPNHHGHFYSTVKGHIVVMDRAMFEYLPSPIDGCLNIVISSSLSKQTPGVFVFETMGEVLRVLDKDMPGRHIFIIGDKGLIELYMDHLDELIVTELPNSFMTDLYAPEHPPKAILAPHIDDDHWTVFKQDNVKAFDSFPNLPYVEIRYYRRKKESWQPNQQNPNPPLEAQARKVVSELKEALRPAKESVQKAVEQLVAKIPQETKDALKKIVPKILDKRKLKRKK